MEATGAPHPWSVAGKQLIIALKAVEEALKHELAEQSVKVLAAVGSLANRNGEFQTPSPVYRGFWDKLGGRLAGGLGWIKGAAVVGAKTAGSVLAHGARWGLKSAAGGAVLATLWLVWRSTEQVRVTNRLRRVLGKDFEDLGKIRAQLDIWSKRSRFNPRRTRPCVAARINRWADSRVAVRRVSDLRSNEVAEHDNALPQELTVVEAPLQPGEVGRRHVGVQVRWVDAAQVRRDEPDEALPYVELRIHPHIQDMQGRVLQIALIVRPQQQVGRDRGVVGGGALGAVVGGDNVGPARVRDVGVGGAPADGEGGPVHNGAGPGPQLEVLEIVEEPAAAGAAAGVPDQAPAVLQQPNRPPRRRNRVAGRRYPDGPFVARLVDIVRAKRGPSDRRTPASERAVVNILTRVLQEQFPDVTNSTKATAIPAAVAGYFVPTATELDARAVLDSSHLAAIRRGLDTPA